MRNDDIHTTFSPFLFYPSEVNIFIYDAIAAAEVVFNLAYQQTLIVQSQMSKDSFTHECIVTSFNPQILHSCKALNNSWRRCNCKMSGHVLKYHVRFSAKFCIPVGGKQKDSHVECLQNKQTKCTLGKTQYSLENRKWKNGETKANKALPRRFANEGTNEACRS